MGITHRFLALESELELVPNWFRDLSPPPTEQPREDGTLYYFPDCGPLTDIAAESPLVSVFLPHRKRGALLTCGEVHFLPTPSSRFRRLRKVAHAFRDWLSQNVLVFSNHPEFDAQWNYYLEGGIRNHDADVFAFPDAFDALSNGHYFVSHDDNESRLDTICTQLDNRGVDGLTLR